MSNVQIKAGKHKNKELERRFPLRRVSYGDLSNDGCRTQKKHTRKESVREKNQKENSQKNDEPMSEKVMGFLYKCNEKNKE